MRVETVTCKRRLGRFWVLRGALPILAAALACAVGQPGLAQPPADPPPPPEQSDKTTDAPRQEQSSERQGPAEQQAAPDESAKGGRQDKADAPAALGVGIAKVEGQPGLRVVEVVRGSPAARAGIQPGDILLSIDEKEITSVPQMIELTREKDPGARVEIKILRDEQERIIQASLGTRNRVLPGDGQERRDMQMPPPQGPQYGDAPQDDRAWLGVILHDMRGQQQDGVVVERVYPSGPAARADLYAGDVIVRADGKDVGSPEEFVQAVEAKDPNDKLKLTVRRDGEEKNLEATLAAWSDFFPPVGADEPVYRGQAEDEEECPMCAMMLEQERHSAKQRQRIEDLVRELKGEIDALRKEVRQLDEATAKRDEPGTDASATLENGPAASAEKKPAERPADATRPQIPEPNR